MQIDADLQTMPHYDGAGPRYAAAHDVEKGVVSCGEEVLKKEECLALSCAAEGSRHPSCRNEEDSVNDYDGAHDGGGACSHRDDDDWPRAVGADRPSALR